jgi:ribosomal-protein-alanine N-acetyltransferase
MEPLEGPGSLDGVVLRTMEESDLPEVMEIESLCYGKECWPVEEFLYRLDSLKANCFVAQKDGKVVAYILYAREWFKVHIENVAVHPDFRRIGLASVMVSHVIADLPRQKRKRIILEVRKSNTGAQDCYRKLGFREVGIRRGYYPPDWEDALLMEYRS